MLQNTTQLTMYITIRSTALRTSYDLQVQGQFKVKAKRYDFLRIPKTCTETGMVYFDI